jgi:hypothetical protein
LTAHRKYQHTLDIYKQKIKHFQIFLDHYGELVNVSDMADYQATLKNLKDCYATSELLKIEDSHISSFDPSKFETIENLSRFKSTTFDNIFKLCIELQLGYGTRHTHLFSH